MVLRMSVFRYFEPSVFRSKQPDEIAVCEVLKIMVRLYQSVYKDCNVFSLYIKNINFLRFSAFGVF